MTALDVARTVSIESVVRARGGKLRRRGRCLVGPCPCCGTGDDRFNVHLTKQRWFCRHCDEGGDVIALVMRIDGCEFLTAVEKLTGSPLSGPRLVSRPLPSPPKNDAAATEQAMSFWRDAMDPRGTPVILYLGHRNLVLPEEAAGEAIRFHPSCKFGLRHVACMLALVRNIVTNAPQAIHRTAVDLSGNKAEVNGLSRMSLGPTAGGAIKLTPDDMVTTCLGIGEGIESTLSMRLVPKFGVSPAWALLSAGGVKHFPVLSAVECLWIAVDNDANGVGQSAAAVCSRDWTVAGREVYRITPKKQDEDFNDLARRASCTAP